MDARVRVRRRHELVERRGPRVDGHGGGRRRVQHEDVVDVGGLAAQLEGVVVAAGEGGEGRRFGGGGDSGGVEGQVGVGDKGDFGAFDCGLAG